MSTSFFAKFQVPLFVLLLASSCLLVWPFPLFDQFEYPKYLAFLACSLLLLTAQLLIAERRWWKQLPVGVLLPLGCLFFGQFIALIFSSDISLSFTGALFRYQGFLTQIFYLLLFLCSFLFFTTTSETEHKRLIQWVVALLVGTTIFSFLTLFHIFPLFDPAAFEQRLFGTLGNPNYLASFIITLFPFFLFLFWQRKVKLVFGSVFFLFALFLTGSRSALLALSVSGISIFFLMKKNKAISFSRHSPLLPLLLFLLLGLSLFFHPYTRQRFSLDPVNFTSFSTRLDLWQAGIKLYRAHPLTGVGQDMIPSHINSYLPDQVRLNTDSYVDRIHSEPLDILLMTGPLTLLGYYGLFFFLFWKANKLSREKGISLVAISTLFALLALGLYHLVNFSTITTNILWYWLLGLLAAHITQKSIHTSIGEIEKM